MYFLRVPAAGPDAEAEEEAGGTFYETGNDAVAAAAAGGADTPKNEQDEVRETETIIYLVVNVKKATV